MLLGKCPDAILALGCGHVGRKDLRANILAHFSSDEVRGRIRFLQREQTEELHRARYQVADLALDTFPYAGTMTSHEALALNVPVITLVGERHVQRTTYSMLKHLGLDDTIAETETEYVDKATFLVNHPESLLDLKERLSKAFRNAAEVSPQACTRNLERTYKTMWSRFIAGQPAEQINLFTVSDT
jgi:predicted O-linked N-acetylglucosamine transferase (SPINDLY family)